MEAQTSIHVSGVPQRSMSDVGVEPDPSRLHRAPEAPHASQHGGDGIAGRTLVPHAADVRTRDNGELHVHTQHQRGTGHRAGQPVRLAGHLRRRRHWRQVQLRGRQQQPVHHRRTQGENHGHRQVHCSQDDQGYR